MIDIQRQSIFILNFFSFKRGLQFVFLFLEKGYLQLFLKIVKIVIIKQRFYVYIKFTESCDKNITSSHVIEFGVGPPFLWIVDDKTDFT